MSGEDFRVDPESLRAAASTLHGHADEVESHGRTLSARTEGRVGHGAIGEVADTLVKRAMRAVSEGATQAVRDFHRGTAVGLAGDQDGIGSLYRHTWRTRLPYNLVFDLRTARLERPHLIEATTAGELEGTGRWQLSSTPARTRAVNEWRVRTAKSWMNLVAPIARPVFAWNHAALMRSGRLDLQRLLDERMVAQGGRPDQVI